MSEASSSCMCSRWISRTSAFSSPLSAESEWWMKTFDTGPIGTGWPGLVTCLARHSLREMMSRLIEGAPSGEGQRMPGSDPKRPGGALRSWAPADGPAPNAIRDLLALVGGNGVRPHLRLGKGSAMGDKEEGGLL